MKQVNLKFKTLDVVRTFLRDNSVEIKLVVSDGREKIFSRSIKLDNTAQAADDLIREVRNTIHSAHRPVSTSDDILSGVIIFKFLDNEDVIMEKITRYFTGIREKFRIATAGKISYYDMEMRVKRTSLKF